KINVTAKGRYDNGHYFGKIEMSDDGTYKPLQPGTPVFKREVKAIKKVGKIKKAEYWECNPCHEQAVREGWLEDMLEKYYGEQCKDFEASCIVCDVWSLYDRIIKADALRGDFVQKYDARADAAYIYIKPKIKRGESARTLELSDFINLDFDKKRNLLGIEVLGIRHMPKVFGRKV
ncbi:MAG: DUF2283 domain-containing protein, partial [DPANN group archaeon]|nr:DUF2283 domain-containing protein [DPANN group archaeon]